MSTPLQNRLVGTIIVAAIAIIFLPDVFDGEKQSYQDDFESIPQAPKFEKTRPITQFPEAELANLAQQTELHDEVALDDDLPENHSTPEVKGSQNNKVKVVPVKKEAKVDVITKPAQTLPKKAVSNEAWVIQLGSFRHQNNVKELVAKLQGNGYTAFTKPIQTKSGTLTKVFVGPELIKSSLEKKLPALQQLTNVKGKIARFYPTKQ